MSAGDNARRALSSFRLEGELVHKENGIGVRRGGSVFEVSKDDILAIRELPGNRVVVSVRANAQLTRTTILASKWWGSKIGFGPIFDDCSDCTECSDCADCTECSVCADCTECSVCADCTECSVCADCTECSVCADCAECSVCVGTAGGYFGSQFASSFVRRTGGRRNRPSRKTRRR